MHIVVGSRRVPKVWLAHGVEARKPRQPSKSRIPTLPNRKTVATFIRPEKHVKSLSTGSQPRGGNYESHGDPTAAAQLAVPLPVLEHTLVSCLGVSC